MRVLVIDPQSQTVEEQHINEKNILPELYKIIGCRTVDCAGSYKGRLSFWVDDEGLYGARNFTYIPITGGDPLAGKIVCTGNDPKTGKSVGVPDDITINEMYKMVFFESAAEAMANETARMLVQELVGENHPYLRIPGEQYA